MKRLAGILLLVLCASVTASAQQDDSEREIRSLLAQFEQAVLKSDVAFFEQVWAEDYTFSTSTGVAGDRAQALAYVKQQKEKPAYRINSYKIEIQRIRVIGNAAFVTGDWTFQSSSVASTTDEPRTDKGRNTVILEKRNGRWVIVSEHESEQPRDRKLMEQQVVKAGRAYNELTKRLKSGRAYADLSSQGEIKALEHTLANEYSYTGADGAVFNKAQELESYKTNQARIISAEVLEQNVRLTGNSSAVETSLIRYAGTKQGNPFESTERHTTIWIFRAYRWQIVAAHASIVK